MRKPFRTLTLTALLVTAASAMTSAEAWTFGTDLRSPKVDRSHRAYPRQGGTGYGYRFGYGTGGFGSSCSQPYGGFYTDCRYGGSSFGPWVNDVPPPSYRRPFYTPEFYPGYEDGYYRGYYDGQRSRRHNQKFRSR